MASRHVSRSVVLQSLFESDVQDAFAKDAVNAVLERNLSEMPGENTDREFAAVLLSGVLEKKDELDGIIAKAAPQWPLDKIAPIDRNVLRIGLYELLFGDRAAVPPKVALNEAIELAKSFGGDSSGRFVNGVLGAVYRSIGSPGKDETRGTPSPLPHEALGGVVVAIRDEDGIAVALVYDVFGRWTLPKGKCVEGELSDSAARRAALEELGVTVGSLMPLGEHEYIAHEPEAGRIARTVGYFLAVLPGKVKLKTQKKTGVSDPRWFTEAELHAIPTYNDLLPILELGIAEAKRI